MDDKQGKKTVHSFQGSELCETVGKKAERKIRIRRNKIRNIWFGLSIFGLIGWSIALPCLLGALLGMWLDEYYPREQSWTLVLLIAGLTIGCFNAWHWGEVERRKISKTKDEDDA